MKVYLFLRGFVGSFFMLVFTAMMTVVAVFVTLFPRSVQDRFLKVWGRVCCALVGIEVSVEGLDNIPQKEGAVILFNHQSYLDVPLLHGYLPMSFRFGAKSELKRIPIFGFVMVRFGVLAITRRDPKKVKKLYDQSAIHLKNGLSYALAPEGGRARSPEIASFKSGPFIFSIESKASILPVVIGGLEEIFPRKKLFVDLRENQKVKVEVQPLVRTDGLSVENRGDLKESVRNTFILRYSSLRASKSGLDPNL